MFFGMDEWLFWLIILVISIIVEASTMMLTTIWLALGSLVAMVLALFGVGQPYQFLAVILISVLSFLLTYKFRHKLRIGERFRIPTNADSLIGKEAVVVSEIFGFKGTGQVRIEGLTWTVKLSSPRQHVAAGEIVKIVGIDGVKLLVEPIE